MNSFGIKGAKSRILIDNIDIDEAVKNYELASEQGYEKAQAITVFSNPMQN